MTAPDRTHDPSRHSWVSSANGHPEFPLQNLPMGVFSTAGEKPRIGAAIGDSILDLKAAVEAGLLQTARDALSGSTLNAYFALSAAQRVAVRSALFDLLEESSPDREKAERALHPASDCTMHLPATIGDYTDFYVGIHHATNVGKVFRPDNPLLPNYKYVPIGYHGRASSVVVSGEAVRRPSGQRKLPSEDAPTFGPARNLDFELELGIWIGPGNDLGEPIPIGAAREHLAGVCLLNDWSARDIQAWEYQPLGPFLAKNFATTISPWVVTAEALAPFRMPQPARPEGDPAPLQYLFDDEDQRGGAFAIAMDVAILTQAMRAAGARPHTISHSHAQHMYWTVAQLIAHHTSNGCNLRPGDLLGSGTISTPDRTGLGALLEVTRGGQEPLTLPSGETRRYLEDGDEIIFTARAEREGFVPIGFGECRARVMGPAA